MKVAILVDSGCYLSKIIQSIKEEEAVEIIPLRIKQNDTKTFDDIDISNNDLIKRIQKKQTFVGLPSTTEQIIAVFGKLTKQYDRIFYLCVGTKFSEQFNKVKKIIDNQNFFKIKLFNTNNFGFAIYELIIKLREILKEHNNDENWIFQQLENNLKAMTVSFISEKCAGIKNLSEPKRLFLTLVEKFFKISYCLHNGKIVVNHYSSRYDNIFEKMLISSIKNLRIKDQKEIHKVLIYATAQNNFLLNSFIKKIVEYLKIEKATIQVIPFPPLMTIQIAENSIGLMIIKKSY